MDWTILNNIISKSENIILSTHVNPDGDGIGSEIGLYYYLISIGKKCDIINTSVLPDHYKFLDPENIIERYDILKRKRGTIFHIILWNLSRYKTGHSEL